MIATEVQFAGGKKIVSQAQILLVDDCKEWREKLRSMLEANPDYQVVAEAGDGLEAIHKAAELHPEIVLLDIGMPILNGIEAAARIRRASPHSKIVFVTQENDRDIRTAALATGAERYLLKSRVVSELIPAMDALVPGECATAGVPDSSNGHDARALARD
jgi:DNA-binding NarL/FixJ family response regulator